MVGRTVIKALKSNAPYDDDEFEERIRDVCRDVGVNPDIADRTIRYAAIGLMICLQRPKSGRGRGQPRKATSDGEVLARAVELVKGVVESTGGLADGTKITDAKVIDLLKEWLPVDPPLKPLAKLVAADKSSLITKVSTGRGLMKK